MKNLLFVYNPHSGRGHIRSRLGQIIDVFTEAGYFTTSYPTQKPLDAYNLVRREEGLYDLIVCGGGDGTLNEVVAALMTYKSQKPRLGYIPAGTTNDFAGSLNIPKDAVLAARQIMENYTILCDVGEFNGRSFDYVAAFGMFSETSYETPQGLKNVWGHQAYVLEGFKSLRNIRTYSLRVTGDRHEIRGEYIYGMVSNSRSVGGFKGIAGKEVQMDDGLFEVVLVKKPHNPAELNLLLNGIGPGSLEAGNKMIERFKTSHVLIESGEPIHWSVDGEDGGSHIKAQINVIPNAIELCIGNPTERGKKALTEGK